MNTNLYKRRRLRSTQPILTRAQFRDLGQKILGLKSFRQSVEFLMDPYNYFKLNKVKMAEIHQYLLNKGITQQKCPSTHIRQGDHSRVLISILFPGYPIIKASEHHYQDQREGRSPQAKSIDLAYDKLPTTDKYERLEELFRIDVNWHTNASNSSIDIPLKKLNRSIVVEGHASSNLNVRLFLYLWTSEFMSWTPSSDFKLFVDQNDKDCLTQSDRDIHLDGFKHIDITEKSVQIQKANRRSTGSVKFQFVFGKEKPSTIRHISVCAVVEKTEEELASQLYLQTSALYIGRAMERSSKKTIPLEQQEEVQKKVVELLNPYDQAHDRLNLAKMEQLFLSCADTFIKEWNDDDEEERNNNDDDDIEVYTGAEVISMLDPISLEKIQHPTRCIFCKHNTCFDAVVFFKFQVKSMNWKCPLCYIKIRGIQDLYIDYQLKSILNKYPEQDKFLREYNNAYSVVSMFQQKEDDNTMNNNKKRSYDVVFIPDDDNLDGQSSVKRVKNII
ncbi:uncharacterized protein BX663DRAFT_525181 [Cokeromyces recurvatus]|uniref:uncharacterized protein n=1 Tax=Cokeromyces recurvatus TaxID=90255 RepID=UPI00221F89EE|nr:uncharacterized protein BX663DRAFT_525181 [Cokeromyces recurvatus]KAI7898406.1 hypothetical protein BX663DRAFT_525181 [Cokeromyces recurvatus]